MEAAGIEANVHTFAAMIDGCARAGQLPKAFGVYGIMISKVFFSAHHVCFCVLVPLYLSAFQQYVKFDW